jgi:hypothetical protein
MFSMNPIKKVMTAGLVAAALGVAPALATAQETAGTAGSAQTETQQGQAGQTGTQTGTAEAQQQAGQQPGGQQGGGDQEAVRQHLSAARQSLAELTQLPAAGELQGEQRQQIADFISRFNEFATATTDWREKYERVDESLDGILDGADQPGVAAGATAGAAGATAGAEAAAGAEAGAGTQADAGAAGTAGAGADFDPTIIAKLRETRQHLDAFELATGDPGFIADRIERILENAATGSADRAAMATGATVGTTGTGTTEGEQAIQQDHAVQGTGASATGMVTLSQSQMEDIRRHLEMLRRR